MRRLISGILPALLSVSLLLAGCEKDQERDTPPVFEEPILVSSSLLFTSPGAALYDMISERVPVLPELVHELGNISKRNHSLRISVYEIVYKSKDIAGNEIILSGMVSVPFHIDGTEMTINNISLEHSIFNIDSDITTVFGALATIRALFGSLVVTPYCQGGGVDKGRPGTYVPLSEHILKARQSIDCELAALEFLRTQAVRGLNVRLSPNYSTYNIGISNGGASALAVMKILESETEYEEVNRDRIHLSGTYMGEGCADYSILLDTFIDNYDKPTQVDRMKPDILISIMTSAYNAHAIYSPKPYFSYEENGRTMHINLESYFSEEFNAARVLVGNEMVSITEACNRGYWYDNLLQMSDDSYILKAGFETLEDIFSPDLFNEDGTVNKSRREWKAIISALKENSLLDGFEPKSKLLIVSSKDDTFIPFEINRQMYENLSDGGRNPNVKLRAISGLDHSDASDLCWIESIVKKNLFQ